MGTVLAAGTSMGFAQTWDGGAGNGNWSSANNWNPDAVPGSNANLTFGGTSQLNITAPWWIEATKISFAADAGAFTIGDGGLRLGSGGFVNNSSTTQTINISNIELSADQTWDLDSGALVIGSGNFDGKKKDLTIQGAGSVTINRAINPGGALDDLTLSGAGARTFGAALTLDGNLTSTNSGAVTFSGTVSAKNDISLGGSAAYTVASALTSDNGDIVIDSASASSFTGTVTATKGGVTVNSSTSTTFGGNVVGQDGVSFTGSGNSTVSGYLESSNGAVTLSGSGNVTAAGINGAGDGVFFFGTGNRTINGDITTSDGFTVSGSGNTTITGSINAGSTAVVLGGSGTISVTGSQINSGGLTIGGSAAISSSANLNLGGGDLTISSSGNVALSGSAINVDDITISGSGNTTFDTQINGTGGTFTQSGSGTTTFTGSGNNYFGSVNVTGGTLVLEQTGGAAIQTNGTVNISNADVVFSPGSNNQITNWTDVTLGDGATLYLNDTTQSIDSLVIAGDAVIDFGTGGSTFDISSISFSSGSTLTVVNWNSSVDYFYADLAPGSSLPQVIYQNPDGSTSAGTWGSGAITPGAPVPEPASVGFIAVGGLTTLALLRRRPRHAA